MRTLAELVSDSAPGWPAVRETLAVMEHVVLPPDPVVCQASLLQMQERAGSFLGSIVLNTGGIVLNHGWLRMYGGSGGALPSIAEVNGFPSFFDPSWTPPAGLIFAHDVLGGVYAVNGPDCAAYGRPGSPGQVVYFTPEATAWDELEDCFADFLLWMLSGDMERCCYWRLFWPGWQEEVAKVGLGMAIRTDPPVWTWAGATDIASTTRTVVPLREQLLAHNESIEEYELADPGPLGKV